MALATPCTTGMFALLAVVLVANSSRFPLRGARAEVAISQCRTCLRPGAHGFPASKGFLGFDEELRVLELDGLVFDFEKIFVLLYHQP